jgi:hypothetical protein
MIRFFLSGLLLAFGPVPAAWAQASACPVPESAALGEIALPWARAGVVQRGALVVLVLGASASVGDAALAGAMDEMDERWRDAAGFPACSCPGPTGASG